MAKKPFSQSLPTLSIIIGVVVVLIISLLIFGKPATSDVVEEETSAPVQVLQEPEPLLVEEPAQPTIVTKTRKATELCQDYALSQGESLELDGNTVIVDRVGKTGVKLTVNDQTIILNEGETERVDGFLLELEERNLLYFALDDPDNSVTLRLGCKSKDENPNDKYVREKGTVVCQDLYTSCVAQFDID